jgi:hypothetical protein
MASVFVSWGLWFEQLTRLVKTTPVVPLGRSAWPEVPARGKKPEDP